MAMISFAKQAVKSRPWLRKFVSKAAYGKSLDPQEENSEWKIKR
jgi:hypothetical protein